jgi:hypothetical protein
VPNTVRCTAEACRFAVFACSTADFRKDLQCIGRAAPWFVPTPHCWPRSPRSDRPAAASTASFARTRASAISPELVSVCANAIRLMSPWSASPAAPASARRSRRSAIAAALAIAYMRRTSAAEAEPAAPHHSFFSRAR